MSMYSTALTVGTLLLGGVAATAGSVVDPSALDACPGYTASNVKAQRASLTADLVLAGTNCSVFGADIEKLSLKVVYETDTRIHVKITDASKARYEVPESVFPRPSIDAHVSPKSAAIQFNYTLSPFSFTIQRTHTREVLFTTTAHSLIFEPQYLRVKTTLPPKANIYGLGEHSNSFHLPTDSETLTLWSRDAYGVKVGTNLYGSHPVYFEHRKTGTHGVFLLNSNGMDIKLNQTASNTTLEYNVIGGVLDFYFLAGSESDPTEVARQYAAVVGTPAEVPYWSFGMHQCRFGYTNFIDVAGVITNYSAAGIPLETMWTDIDYMDRRRIFTVDPQYFPMSRMREIVSYLHAHDQRYVLMTNPAVAYAPGEGYGPYDRGTDLDVWLKQPNGTASLGLVWPGVSVFPDWFHPRIQNYWNGEFEQFHNPKNGIDIDGSWLDMNEPTNFCNFPCEDPFSQAIERALPPRRTKLPPDPNTPIFVNSNATHKKRDDLLEPPYSINNAAGKLTSHTAYTHWTHANGLNEYDTHNLYGTMMSTATHLALASRRPGLKTFVITRSTFAGAGKQVGKWLGDNLSTWSDYRNSISGILGFAGVYQIPMVGADICGFSSYTTETLCARWAMLGAFYPFMRNHNQDYPNSQEFYRWPVVAEAAKYAIDIRYRLIDYIYTAFHQANKDGTPVIQPLWFQYPKDPTTYPIDLQFFFGDSILVSPVTEEDSTSVSIYLPKDVFYDFDTLAPVHEFGSTVTLTNVSYTSIPVHIRGGIVLPLRAKSAMTTVALRKEDFELVVAPGTDGKASGTLYVDDGVSLVTKSTEVGFAYSKGKLDVTGSFGYTVGVKVSRVRFLGVKSRPAYVLVSGKTVGKDRMKYNQKTQVLDVEVGLPLMHGFVVSFEAQLEATHMLFGHTKYYL